jgi:hypothetical protein
MVSMREHVTLSDILVGQREQATYTLSAIKVTARVALSPMHATQLKASRGCSQRENTSLL